MDAATVAPIVMSGCRRCAHIQPLGGLRCANCWERELAPVGIGGGGIVCAHTSIHRAVTGEVLAEPRHLAVIDLDHPGAPRVLARLASAPQIGDHVHVLQRVDEELATYTAELG